MADDGLLSLILDAVREHQSWATAIVALVVLAESVAFLSLAVPGTATLMAAGAMAGLGLLSFWELAALSVLACLVGDAISFAAGRALGPRADRIWPFSRRPGMLAAGERFFARWGAWGLLFARFVGPLRAVAPLCAGALGMRAAPFAAMSAASATVFVLAMTGSMALTTRGALERLSPDGDALLALAPFAMLAALVVAAAWFSAAARRKRAALRASDRNAS